MVRATPAEVQKYLADLDYPANRDELVDHARSHGANEGVLETLKKLPTNEFRSPVDVSKAIGQESRMS